MKILQLFAVIVLLGNPSAHAEIFRYEGDVLPTDHPFDGWFHTVSDVGTSWSSDGEMLTMQATSAIWADIWFGFFSTWPGQPKELSFSDTTTGNKVEARLSVGDLSGGWTFYFCDGPFGAGFALYENGFEMFYGLPGQGGSAFFASDTMNDFHTYGAHLVNGQVAYFLDGLQIGAGPSVVEAASDLLILGDYGGRYGDGTLAVDWLSITTYAGPLPVPEPTTTALIVIGSVLSAYMRPTMR